MLGRSTPALAVAARMGSCSCLAMWEVHEQTLCAAAQTTCSGLQPSWSDMILLHQPMQTPRGARTTSASSLSWPRGQQPSLPYNLQQSCLRKASLAFSPLHPAAQKMQWAAAEAGAHIQPRVQQEALPFSTDILQEEADPGSCWG